MLVLYIYNKTSIKRNIITIKQNTSGSRSGYGLISTPVLAFSEADIFGQAPYMSGFR